MKAVPVLILLLAAFYCSLPFNPFGLEQRLLFGMRPPFRWVQVIVNSPEYLDETYVGSNDKVCAEVYRYASLATSYTVYGYGFRETYASREAAENRARKECR